MAVNAYLKIDGREGDSSSKKGCIDVLSFSFGGSMEHVIGHRSGGGEARVGRATIQPLTVMMAVNKTTPPLFDDCVTGNVLKTVDLTYDKPMGDQQEEYFAIHLENALITTIQDSGSDENPMQSISFAMEKYKVGYNPEEGGKLKGWVWKGWDLMTMKPW
jgi:type VI secretion system secreted protein Hcp